MCALIRTVSVCACVGVCGSGARWITEGLLPLCAYVLYVFVCMRSCIRLMKAVLVGVNRFVDLVIM